MERKVYRFSTLFVFFIIILLFTLTPVRAEGNTFKPSEGSYKISTVEDLKNFRNSIKEATTYYDSEKKEQITVTLENDIVIGTADDIGVTTGGQFLGYFNGNGYKISGFNDNKSSFFGSLATEDQFNKSTNMPVITNFILDVDLDISFTGTKNLTKGRTYSILADSGYGKIAYCGVEGEIKASVSGVDSSSNNKRTQLIITGIDALIYSDKTCTPIENCYVNLEIDAITNSKLKNPAYFSYYGFTEDQCNVKNSYITGTVKITETSENGDTSKSMIYGIGNIYNGVTSQAGFYDSSEGKLGSLPNIVANSGIPIKSDVTKSSSYVGFNFDSVWTTNGDTSYPLLQKNQSNLPKSTKEAQVAKKEATVDLNVKVTPKNIADIQLGGGNDIVAALKTDYTIEIGGVSGVLASDLATFISDYNLKVMPDEKAKITLNPYTTGEKAGYEGKYISGSSVSLTYDQTKDYTLTLGKINYVSSVDGEPIQLIGNDKDGEKGIPDEAKQAQLVQNAIKAIDICMNSFYGEGKVPDVTDSSTPWYIMTMARSGYEVPQSYYDTYYQALSTYLAGLPKDETTGYIKDYLISDYVRPLLAVTAIGYDPRNVGGVDLLAPLMDIEKIKYDKDHGNMTAEYYALIGLDACGANSDKANAARTYLVNALGTSLAADTSTAPLYDNPDMAFMMMQGVAPYYNTDANVAAGVDKLLNRAKAGQNAFGGWIGFDVFNPCNIAQVIAGAASVGDNVLTDTGFIKNGYTLLDAGESYFDFENNKIFPFGGGSYGSSNLGQGQFQLPYAFEGALRAMCKSRSGSTNRLYDMSDVKNSTIAVNDAIAALPAVDTITDDTTKAAAQEKLTAVDTLLSTLTLTDTQKNSIDKSKYNAVKARVEGKDAQSVTALIDALPSAETIALSNKPAVVAARSAYSNLSSDEQKKVTNFSKLEAAEAKIKALEDAGSASNDQIAAEAVIAKINALGTITSYDQKAAVVAARSAYNGLTVAQKALISTDTLTLLKNAEAAIEALKPDAGSITIDVERFTIGQGFYVEPMTLSIKEGQTARQAIEELLGAENLVGEVGYLRAVTGADAGSATIPDYIVSELKGDDSTKANAYVSRYGGNILGEFDYSKYSGWMYFVNNETPNVGMNNYTLKDGDVMRLAFTYWGTGSDLTGIEYGSNKELVTIADKDSLIKALAAVNTQDKDSYLADAAVKTAYDTGMTLVQNMTAGKKETKDAAAALNKAMDAHKATDVAAAKTVEKQIKDLPAVDKLVLSDKAAVAAARSAYTALTTAQKALVTNFNTLTAAEAKIASLEPAPSPTPTPTPTPEPGSAKDDATGVEVIGLPTGTGIKVIGEEKDQQKAEAAEKAAEAAGITNAKVVSLYDIKPDISADELAKFNADPTTYVTINLPLNSDQLGYDNYMVYHKTEAGTVEWITPTLSADGKTLTFKVNAFSEFGVVGEKNETKTVNCSYQTQIENIGWQEAKTNGETSGTSQQSLRLEGIKINLDKAGYDLGVSYQTHVQDLGWQGFRTDGTLSGTENQAKRLEAIQIKLTGADADKFDIYYRVHAQNYGWLGWTKNGASAGTEGLSLRLEAIEIKVVAKDAAAPGTTEQSFVTGNIKCSYQTQIENIGWQDVKRNGDLSGTTGQALRLEGIKINLDNAGYDVGLSYQTHVQDIGWQELRTTGTMSGTEGQSKRLEAIRISLTGADAELCDIYYQVHAENIGWMGWAKNGESAGTEGFAYRLEGIRIMVVPKGAAAPGTTDSPFVSNK